MSLYYELAPCSASPLAQVSAQSLLGMYGLARGPCGSAPPQALIQGMEFCHTLVRNGGNKPGVSGPRVNRPPAYVCLLTPQGPGS